MFYQSKSGALFNLAHGTVVYRVGEILHVQFASLDGKTLDTFDDEAQAAAILNKIAGAIRDGIKLFAIEYWLNILDREIAVSKGTFGGR